ncbi:putative aquaporin-10 [Dirofilaria immitis]|nr:putative aquaporin-10 [Dirofilaria immitis]
MRVWIASLIFYLSIFIICELLRYIIHRWLIRRLPRFLIGLLLEVTTASRKRLALRTAFLVFVVQLSAAYLSYCFARTFWKFGLHPMHNELLIEAHCEADLTASYQQIFVALTAGSLIEGLATFSSKAVEFFAAEWYVNSSAQMLINCIFAGFITAVGINYTGMYANPIVAWACTFNCRGVTHLGHLIVYWLSPLTGWFLADAVFGEQECISNVSPKKEKRMI